MSAYGDYKAGLITDFEYNAICNREAQEAAEWNEEEEFEEDEIDEF